MNPAERFEIGKIREILKEIEKHGEHAYLRDLENRIIKEIVRLVSLGTESAKSKLDALEKELNGDLQVSSSDHVLISALKKSVSGALETAKIYLL